MNIILLGYMGSGKTSFGKKLASKLNLRFIDTDKIIENEENKSIFQIFEQDGEKYFRELEKKLIFRLKTLDNLLISTGGGMPCFNNLIDEIKKIGLSIYIKHSEYVLANRILNSNKKRPLIAGKSKLELFDFISKSLSERTFFYEQAHIILDGKNISKVPIEFYKEKYLTYFKPELD